MNKKSNSKKLKLQEGSWYLFITTPNGKLPSAVGTLVPEELSVPRVLMHGYWTTHSVGTKTTKWAFFYTGTGPHAHLSFGQGDSVLWVKVPEANTTKLGMSSRPRGYPPKAVIIRGWFCKGTRPPSSSLCMRSGLYNIWEVQEAEATRSTIEGTAPQFSNLPVITGLEPNAPTHELEVCQGLPDDLGFSASGDWADCALNH